MAGPEAKAPTVMELLQLASKYLGERGIESPRLDAEVLLAHVLRTDRMGLYVHHDRLLEGGEVDAYRRLIADRARHRPVAQLTGVREFFGLTFRVTPDVLTPRPETELLVEGALERLDERRPARVLDVGTGSGAIAVSVARHRPLAHVWAIDVSEAALKVARHNAKAHGVSERIRFAKGEWLDPVTTGAEHVKFDVILSNPPYIPSAEIGSLPVDVSAFEPHLALDGGADGLDPHRILLRHAGDLIRSGGWLGLEIGDGQEIPLTRLAEKVDGFEHPLFHRDLQEIPRVCWLRRKGADPSVSDANAPLDSWAHGSNADVVEWRDAPWHAAYRRSLLLADRVVDGTVVLKIDPDRPDPKKVRAAAHVLARGGLVAFPTETVYGLGADAGSAEAVRTVYEAKGRPQDNPLIVHTASLAQVRDLCPGCDESLLEAVERLADAFWPGPLTLILPDAGTVSDAVTGGRDTVAIRVPANPVARALIAASGRPVAAPSANRSGRPSPSQADHVLDDLAGLIPILIDSGATDFGIESTVLDLTVLPPVVLRPGSVTPDELEAVLGGPVQVEGSPGAGGKKGDDWSERSVSPRGAAPVGAERGGDEGAFLPPDSPAGEEGAVPPRSPGMKYRHYAPRQPMWVLEGPPAAVVDRVVEDVLRAERRGERVGLLLTRETAEALKGTWPGGTLSSSKAPFVIVLGHRSQPEEAAARLFASLREMDAAGVDRILAEGIEESGMGLAVMNRMRKAAGGKVERLGASG